MQTQCETIDMILKELGRLQPRVQEAADDTSTVVSQEDAAQIRALLQYLQMMLATPHVQLLREWDDWASTVPDMWGVVLRPRMVTTAANSQGSNAGAGSQCYPATGQQGSTMLSAQAREDVMRDNM
jgi:hypothetical protein